MVAFVSSVVLFVVSLGVALLVMQRRPVGVPLTWGEAILAATFVFAIMLLGYAVVPNQWLQWEQNELGWRKDVTGIPVGPLPIGGDDHTLFENGIQFFGRGKITVTKEAVGDIIAVVIYGVMLGLHIFLWSAWQKRGRARETTAELPVSQFGRPLRRV